jgi:hypothetical protein
MHGDRSDSVECPRDTEMYGRQISEIGVIGVVATISDLVACHLTLHKLDSCDDVTLLQYSDFAVLSLLF